MKLRLFFTKLFKVGGENAGLDDRETCLEILVTDGFLFTVDALRSDGFTP